MEEKFVFVFEDGPFPGEHLASSEEIDWPLPEFVFAEGYEKGIYKKFFESKGKPKPRVGKKEYRGAQYKWDKNYTILETSQ